MYCFCHMTVKLKSMRKCRIDTIYSKRAGNCEKAQQRCLTKLDTILILDFFCNVWTVTGNNNIDLNKTNYIFIAIYMIE